jgi:hypothetical protein
MFQLLSLGPALAFLAVPLEISPPRSLSAEDLVLLIEPSESCGTQHNCAVQITVANHGETYYVLFPNFIRDALGETHPWPILSFLIMNPQGDQAPRTGRWLERLRYPSAGEFLILGPGSFYGEVVRLDEGPYAHGFTAPGEYAIQASLSVSAREWLESSSERETTRFDHSRLFSGTLKSRRIWLRCGDRTR